MSELKAGDLAVLDGKEIVPIKSHDTENDVYYIPTIDHPIYGSRLQRCYTVTILPDGRAKEVNPLGEEPEMKNYFDRTAKEWAVDFKAWDEAESKLLTLPCAIQKIKQNEVLYDSSQGKHFDNTKSYLSSVTSKQFYAYIENETFILVKPVKS